MAQFATYAGMDFNAGPTFADGAIMARVDLARERCTVRGLDPITIRTTRDRCRRVRIPGGDTIG